MDYCHPCGARQGYFYDVDPADLLQNAYQVEKFRKHTTFPLSHAFTSVFNTTRTGEYGDYVVDTAASGVVEVDPQGRRNIM